MPALETTNQERHNTPRAILEVTVRNHPGVMSHVCGLFSRRAYNMEGILCMPVGDGTTSRMWLLVKDDVRLEQMVKQIHKLEDVLSIRRHGADHAVFVGLEDFFQEQ
ncbi:MAG TPA: acetolactate synthase small subunit [bacterium]|nr:acetolactate synthase small subunit [bacterium]